MVLVFPQLGYPPFCKVWDVPKLLEPVCPNWTQSLPSVIWSLIQGDHLVIGLLIYNFAPKVFNFVMGGSSDAKEYCGQSPRVLNDKTNKAAKLAFKSCVKRYDR